MYAFSCRPVVVGVWGGLPGTLVVHGQPLTGRVTTVLGSPTPIPAPPAALPQHTDFLTFSHTLTDHACVLVAWESEPSSHKHTEGRVICAPSLQPTYAIPRGPAGMAPAPGVVELAARDLLTRAARLREQGPPRSSRRPLSSAHGGPNTCSRCPCVGQGGSVAEFCR